MLEAKIRKKIGNFKLDVNFKTENQVIALFGPSGSGKSMTLNCIAGLMQPDEGRIILNQKVLFDSKKGVNVPPQERKIGFVFQNYALFPHMSVFENIAFGIRKLPKREQEERVASLLKRVRLNGLEKRYPHQLSGGQQQRVAMARALAIEPEILLLDEPFSALDTNVKNELHMEILEMQQYYQGDIVLITHNLAEAFELSSKIAVYQMGRIVQYESKEEILNNPVNKDVAALTGMKNFIEGQVHKIMGNAAVIKTSLGMILVSIRNMQNLLVGKKIIMGIRPEFISISNISNKPKTNTLKSKLIKIVEGIFCYRYEFVTLCDDKYNYHFYVEVPKIKDPSYKPGKEYLLYLPPERIVLMIQ
jgi:molybdate transport system ATP-binding protein